MRPMWLLAAFAAAFAAAAQDLPDPGRRLSPEEQKADPEKRSAPARQLPRSEPARDPKACRNARIYYQAACGAPGSERSYGKDCAEAYALYRESCP